MKSRNTTSDLVVPNVHKYFLLISVLVLVVALGVIMSSFFPAVMLAAVLASGLYPLHRRINSTFRFAPVSATLSVIIVLFMILAPLAWFLFHIADQAFNVYRNIEPKVFTLLDVNFLPSQLQGTRIGMLFEKFQGVIPISTQDVVGFATTIVQYVSEFIVNQSTTFAKSVSVFAIHIIVFILALFFFFKDGPMILNEMGKYVPLPQNYRRSMILKLKEMSRGIMLGVFGASILQGIVGGIGMSIVGLENVAFFATMMAFSSMIPYVGAFIIWGPASMYLLATGDTVGGVFLFFWGIGVISMIDNFVKPYIIGEHADIHPLLSFLSILGGMFTMGLPGIIIAPYVLTLTLSFLHIYQKEYAKVLK